MKGAYGEAPFDLIHILTRTGVVGRLLAEKFGVPYVITEQWSRYFRPTAGLRDWVSYALARYAARGLKALAYVSRQLADAMATHGVESERMVYIPNVVDTELFRPAESPPRAAGGVSLIHISCFEEASKNISGLIKAVAILNNQGVAVNVCMVGDGAYRNEAERLTQALGIEDRFNFKGMMQPADVAKELAQTDFLIQSSRYETFGAVVVEAWACGVPVISTRVGVFGEMFESSLGELISGTDPASIAAGVKEAMARQKTFSRQRIRQTALDHFGEKKVGAALKSLYEDSIRAGSH